jgi:hypothetical protein
MHVNIMRPGGGRSQHLIEKVEGRIRLMIFLSGHSTLMLQRLDELLASAGVHVGMEEMSVRITLFQPKETGLLSRDNAPKQR